MRLFLGLTMATVVIACSTAPGNGSSSAVGSTGTPSSGGSVPTSGGNAATSGGSISPTTGGTAITSGGSTPTTGGATTTGGTGTTGGQCQISWPPRDCLAIAVCECVDGTEQDFGCVGPPTCGDACCGHGGPLSDAGLNDAGVCQTEWPPRGCQAESICTCGDGTEQEFGCFGAPTCGDACCGHDGPGNNPPGDGGVCQTWPPLSCDAIFLCHCGDGMTEEAGCVGPPTCGDACCGHGNPAADGGASDGGICQTAWPMRDCLAEALCDCGDGTTQEFGCIGPPTCDDACCGHDGPGSDGGAFGGSDAGTGTVDAGADAGQDAGPSDAGPVEIPGDAGLASDGGICPFWPPKTCLTIEECTCGDGTKAEALCAGPPNCNDACCGHDGSEQD
jgi:hypothetical protein